MTAVHKTLDGATLSLHLQFLADSSNRHSVTIPGTASGDVEKADTPCMKCDCHAEKKKLELLHEQEAVQKSKEKR